MTASSRTIVSLVDLERQLLRSANLLGYGIGTKRRAGLSTGERGVVVFVAAKRHLSEVPEDERVPPVLRTSTGPQPTDVVQLGAPNLTLPVNRDRLRPAPNGVSVGSPAGTPSTLGVLVRDKTDGTTAILGTSGGLAYGAGTSGTKVYQPSPLTTPDPNDLIGTVTRSTRLSLYPALYPPPSGQGTSPVDAALVRPTQPTQVIDQVRNQTMPTATPLHPLVGLITGFVTADDGTFLCVAAPAASMLSALQAETFTPGSTADPELGRRLSFYGASFGQRDAVVAATHVTYKVTYATPSGPMAGLLADSFLVETGYGAEDDMGAALYAFAGNQVESQCAGCALALTLQRTYSIPLVQNVPLADKLRDDYLLKTLTGQLLVQLFYKNQQTIQARVGTASPTQAELDYAERLYTKYQARAQAEISHVTFATVPLSAEMMDEARAAAYGLSRFMTDDEYAAVQALLDIVGEVQDMALGDAMAYMDQPSVRDRVYAVIEPLPGWDTSYDAS